MKKILIALSVVVAIAAVVLGLYINSDYSFSFIETYKKNFTDNIVNLKIQYEMRKAQKEQEELLEKENETENEEQPPVEEVIDTPQESVEPVKINYTELTKEFVSKADPIAFSSASNARFENYSNGMLCVVENLIVFYNKNGTVEWSVPIQISNPVLKVQGSYIMLFEHNGNKILLYNGKKQLFQVETKEKILTGNLSANGDCAVLTEKAYYKGAVEVYNKSGQEIYARSFGKNSAISVAISDSRRLCVSLMSVDGGVSSQIVFLDIGKKNEDVTVDYKDSVIFDLDFVGNTLHAFADNQLIALNNNGKQLWKYNYSQRTLNKYATDDSNIRLMLFDASNSAELCVVTTGGREKQRIKEDIVPDFCDIRDGYILYNGGRSLYLTKSNGTPLAKYVASRDMKNAYFIDSDNILVVYSSSIEFLHIEKGE